MFKTVHAHISFISYLWIFKYNDTSQSPPWCLPAPLTKGESIHCNRELPLFSLFFFLFIFSLIHELSKQRAPHQEDLHGAEPRKGSASRACSSLG